MKYLWLFGMILGCSFHASAQKYIDSNKPDDVKSLLSKDNEITGFGGLEVKTGEFVNDVSVFTGAFGGVIINKHYMLGMAGYGLTTSSEFTGIVPGFDTPKELDMYGGYGGLLIGGIIAPKSIVHVAVPVILGAGNIYISDEDFFNNTIDTDFTIDQSTFFVIEPGLSIEANITPVFRISIGASYRMVRGSSLNQPIDDDDLSDLSGSFSLRFGRF
ncbi:MAG: hypothetical protein WBA74_18945 [Cyclobacteriaceae bacterium]